MYTLIWTKHFSKTARKFIQKHSELKKRLSTILIDLEKNPFQPHLRLHSLKGKLEGTYAISVTHSYRITLTLKITEKEITLLDIGNHDEVY